MSPASSPPPHTLTLPQRTNLFLLHDGSVNADDSDTSFRPSLPVVGICVNSPWEERDCEGGFL